MNYNLGLMVNELLPAIAEALARPVGDIVAKRLEDGLSLRKEQTEPVWKTVAEICEEFQVSKTFVHTHIAKGQVRTWAIGECKRVDRNDWVRLGEENARNAVPSVEALKRGRRKSDSFESLSPEAIRAAFDRPRTGRKNRLPKV